MSWSGGKDSALALHELRASQQFEIAALLTTVTKDYDRISMHGVRRVLLERQAAGLGLPLEQVLITRDATNEEYEDKMRAVLERYRREGVVGVAFGDIFLEDLRKYREDNLATIEMTGFFPLWKRDTAELANAFIDLGFQAMTTCVDGRVLGREFVGRRFDRQFLAELPANVDPCGENGEFHSFTYQGPGLAEIRFALGETVLREDRFIYSDLVPV